MKISFFIGGLSGGGAERVICNMANYLGNKGHEIKVITMADDTPDYPLSRNTKRIILLRTCERKGFFRNSLLRWWRLLRYVRKSKCDSYVVVLPVTIIMLLALRVFTRAKIVASERNTPAKYNKRIRFFLKLLANNANGWIFQTEENQLWYKNAIKDSKTIVIPNAINPDFIREIYQGERMKTIVTAGRLTNQKNQILLVRAFAQISSIFPEYQLIIYGDGSLKGNLEETAEQLGVKDQVILPGYTTNIGDKIKDASLFVLSSDFEGMPNALMEAMALGLPCISTDCDGGGAKFLIENEKNGLLVPKGDAKALSEAMRKMLSEKEFAEQCGREAHKICDRLAPERIYGEWEQFIKDVVEDK